MSDQPDRKRQQRGADQRARDDRTNLERVEAQIQQIDRQQQRNEPIAECTNRPRAENPARVSGRARWNQPRRRAFGYASSSSVILSATCSSTNGKGSFTIETSLPAMR